MNKSTTLKGLTMFVIIATMIALFMFTFSKLLFLILS